jgi:phage tail tape-measure protein
MNDIGQMRRELVELAQQIGRQEAQLDALIDQVAEIGGNLATLKNGYQQLVKLIDRLEGK